MPHVSPFLRDAGNLTDSISTFDMRKIFIPTILALLLLTACSPRDFLTRRLAGDLIADSEAFKTPQQFVLQTGVISNNSLAPEYMILQRHGWINVTAANCPRDVAPPPCWDIGLTPSGVETVRTIVSQEEAQRSSIRILAAKRSLIRVTGISRQGIVADVEFTWKWIPLNEIGAALYPDNSHYVSTVGFRQFDDGWRVTTSTPRARQTLDDALKGAEPAP